MGRWIARALVVAALLAAAGAMVGRAAAATFPVDTTLDTSDVFPGDGICADVLANCSLRAAIEQANALAGADTITVPAGTYDLTLGELHVTDGLTLAGAGAPTTIVEPALIAPSRVFEVSAPSTISGLTIRNGFVAGDGDGGGVLTTAALTLDHVIVSDNTATGTGGGIAADGPSGSLVLTDSTVSSNHAQAGGGILLQSDPNTGLLVRDTITGNTAVPGDIPILGDGGGIRAAGVITIANSTVTGNSAPAVV
jgi:predicted outer membrane repeat protein